MPMNQKVLFCGLGSIGQRHLRNLRALRGDSVEVLAYRTRRTSPVLNPNMTVRSGPDDLETTYNIRSFDDLDAALAEKPDAMFVTNPNSLHLPVALAGARAGCHLFIENRFRTNSTAWTSSRRWSLRKIWRHLWRINSGSIPASS